MRCEVSEPQEAAKRVRSISSPEPLFPLFRVLRAVEYGVNDEICAGWFIEDFKRETPDGSPPEFVHCGRIHVRMSQGHEKASLDAPKEVFAETGLAILIPSVCRRNVFRCLRGEDDVFNHFGHVPAASPLSMEAQKPGAAYSVPYEVEVLRASIRRPVWDLPPRPSCPRGPRRVAGVLPDPV